MDINNALQVLTLKGLNALV